ncbi:phosphoheptose isomerase [Methylosoma difficile]
MSLQDRIINHFTDNIQTQQQSIAGLCELIEYASQRMVNALLNDKKILACGNGFSATTVQLLVAAMLNQFERDRPSLPAIALNTDAVTLTAIANDYHFDDIFAKQVRALGQNGDILLVYTESDHCSNIAKAISAAHDKDISVIALTGDNNGMLSPLLHETDIEVRVPAQSCARIHETHVLITHCLCDLIDHQLFG